MIHYSASVPHAQVVAVPCGMGLCFEQTYVYMIEKLGLPTSTLGMTGAEERVCGSLRSWLFDVLSKENTSDIANGAFVHTNLNTGVIHVFVAWCGYEDFAVQNSLF